MKLSDYVAKFLASKGVDKAFVLTGGCILHCIDSVAKTVQPITDSILKDL